MRKGRQSNLVNKFEFAFFIIDWCIKRRNFSSEYCITRPIFNIFPFQDKVKQHYLIHFSKFTHNLDLSFQTNHSQTYILKPTSLTLPTVDRYKLRDWSPVMNINIHFNRYVILCELKSIEWRPCSNPIPRIITLFAVAYRILFLANAVQWSGNRELYLWADWTRQSNDKFYYVYV